MESTKDPDQLLSGQVWTLQKKALSEYWQRRPGLGDSLPKSVSVNVSVLELIPSCCFEGQHIVFLAVRMISSPTDLHSHCISYKKCNCFMSILLR